MRKYIAECIGTMVLTLLGCGTARSSELSSPAEQALKDLWVFIVAPPSAAEPSAPSYGQHSRQQLTRSSFSTCHPKP